MGGFRFPVTAAVVGNGAVVETAELVGDVVSSRRSTLAFDRNGTLFSVSVRMGDRVTKGQLLAELDDSVLAQDLASAQAAAEVAAEEAKFAAREAQRAREVGVDVVSDSERERLQSNAAIAERRLVQRQSEAARLQAQLDKGKLRAPFAGVIARRMLDEGAQAGPNAAVFDLVDPDHREVRLEVPAPLVGDPLGWVPRSCSASTSAQTGSLKSRSMRWCQPPTQAAAPLSRSCASTRSAAKRARTRMPCCCRACLCAHA